MTQNKHILEYTDELFKKRVNGFCDEQKVQLLKNKLEEEGCFQEAEEEIARQIAEEEVFKKAESATSVLLHILENLNIWNIGKNDKELAEVRTNLMENDKSYMARVFLYQELLALPKYSSLNEQDKILLAMKLGALDFSDLTHENK